MSKLSLGIKDIQHIEELAERKTLIHSVRAESKTVLTFLYLLLTVSYSNHDIGGLLVFAFYPLLLLALAEIPYRMILKRVLLVMPFVLFMGLTDLFLQKETALMVGGIIITEGMLSCLTLLLKTILTVTMVLILIATTSVKRLSEVLIRFKIPEILVMQLEMTYRYLSVLIEESQLMYRAYLLRMPGCRAIRMKDMGFFLGSLIVRSIDSAEQIYHAMKCRGFDGIGQRIGALDKWKVKDSCILITQLLLLISVRLIFRSF